MNNFTLEEFSELLNMEQNVIDTLSIKLEQPGTAVVNKIIAYSRVVSVKKLSTVEPFVFLLN